MDERVFFALGNKTRLQIVKMLCEKDMYAGEIAECFPIAQPSVSRHLEVLRRARVVTIKKEGTKVKYSLDFDVLKTASLCLMEKCMTVKYNS